ncbi:putative receptor-like protein kinase At3g47110 [Populus nigra]|uniref:putative receptor-like protein kinase At3g47110 n=1 Tax=Populus nigra TaxID=3691 RepID=UPI002B26AFE7|nr:putative receptor-like protein kinase At3g47110 [Populus nigra]
MNLLSPFCVQNLVAVLIVLMQGKALLLISTSSFLLTAASTITAPRSFGGNETDYEALLAFKAKIQDPHSNTLSSWNDSLGFCNWPGITCGRRHGRVRIINLVDQKLAGSLSPYVGNISFLQEIRLANNTIHGEIPLEVGRLLRLRVLMLTDNSIEGKIPANLSGCSSLAELYIDRNKLGGEIPMELGFLSKLTILSFGQNNLQGKIPHSIGNLTSLESLSLRSNVLEGTIPDSLGRLKRLTSLLLGENKLSGFIPPSLYNLSLITTFYLGGNGFRGSLPSNLGLSFPHLQWLALWQNQFSGPIPGSLSNASELEIVSFTYNSLTGKIPDIFGKLHHLSRLHFGSNNLGAGGDDEMAFLASLTNCSMLKVVSINNNRLEGSLPITVGNLSTYMVYFGLSGNHIVGRIPSGNLSLLSVLYLDDNKLKDTIPASLGGCKNLVSLGLSRNNLNGSIPEKLFGTSSVLFSLNLSHNQFTGSLPSTIGSLKGLSELDVSWNMLSGEIPTSLGGCTSLEVLHMEDNFFQGSIPSSFSSLRGIQFLDLSCNNLSGQLPNFLVTIPFISLNLSSNNFEGEVPRKGVFTNKSAVSVVGNDKLCGGILELHLPECPNKEPKKTKMSHLQYLLAITIPCALVGAITVSSFLFCWFKKKRKEHSSDTLLKESFPQISYERLFKATDGFSTTNLIGVGGFSSVYKGKIDEDGTLVAIKVLNLQRRGASKSFKDECEALRNIRHRNLVKIITSSSSIDFQGNNFKALVYEYMPKGSLEKWLHPTQETHDDQQINQVQRPNLLERINIAIDVAAALDYLHHHCHSPIIHCDVKPSNILLDKDMIGHLGDFGLARIFQEFSEPSLESSSAGIKGTTGYAAPGKRPIDETFEKGLNLHMFAKMALPDHVMEITDPVLLSERHLENAASMEECLTSLVKIGVACSMDSPRDRMDMSRVVRELLMVRDTFQGTASRPENNKYPGSHGFHS